MSVYQIYADNSLRNFSYIVVSVDRKTVVCVDPFDAGQIAQFLEKMGLGLAIIINTHEHNDHTCGNAGLVDRFKARVYAHPGNQHLIPCFDEGLEDQAILRLGEDHFRVIHTPGHCNGHISLVLNQNKQDHCVFSGDTVFNAGVGNCYNGGNPVELYQSVESVYKMLEDSVLLYPGHDYLSNNLRFTLNYEPQNQDARDLLENYQTSFLNEQSGFIQSNMGLERKINLFFRTHESHIQDQFSGSGISRTEQMSNQDVFVELRRLRDMW